MNSSTGKSTAFLPLPYSVARGPTALKTMSMRPACLTMPSTYALTAASSRASTTCVCARPPDFLICSATASTLDLLRPDRNTSAPSAANSLATAAPTEPPAPNTTAYFPFRREELVMEDPAKLDGEVIVLSLCFDKRWILDSSHLRRLGEGTADICCAKCPTG